MGGSDPTLAGALAVVGLGVTNTAAARALRKRGHDVVLIDDRERDTGESLAEELGVRFLHAPSHRALKEVIVASGAMLPAPGLPETHDAFAIATAGGVPVLSEFDLAAAWDDRDVIAVTGTNGKTTVVSMVVAMLEASGVHTAAVGNLEVPLVAAIDDPGPICFVVEASSFRLGHSRYFAPRVGTWLNFSADHLDVHLDMETYRAAKARVWANMGPGDTAVLYADDRVVSAAAPRDESVRVWRFGSQPEIDGEPVEFFERDATLIGPGGVELVAVADLWRSLPHDRLNALAAAATALAGGAELSGIRRALAEFRGLPHRVELVGETGGVRFYDDSKATAPHATVAATAGFDRVVLVAGGRNKGLDLSALAEARSVVGVVGIGEAGPQIREVFRDRPGCVAATMSEAVARAVELAGPGDVVLLSPGCASFDWYRSYAERGDDFATEVRARIGQRR